MNLSFKGVGHSYLSGLHACQGWFALPSLLSSEYLAHTHNFIIAVLLFHHCLSLALSESMISFRKGKNGRITLLVFV